LQRKGERDKAGDEIERVSLKPQLVLFATLYFLLLLTMDCGERERIQKKGRAKNRSAILGLIIF